MQRANITSVFAGILIAALGVLGSVAHAADDAGMDRETECLAKGIYFEARGEPEKGQWAVGRVILNRVASKYYPDTICGVVYQNQQKKNRCQFSFACDGMLDLIKEEEPWVAIAAIAEELVASGESSADDETVVAALDTSTHYHAVSVSPSWSKKLRKTGQVGRHVFYYAKTA